MKNIGIPIKCSSGLLRIIAASFLAFLWTSSSSIIRGDSLDYAVQPRATDNFADASFRCVNPGPQTSPNYVLVFIPGTNGDGRGIVADPKFLSISKACHAILVGCDFQGIELYYDSPGGGSGRALDEAIAYFGGKLGQPNLASLPLLLIGHSQGGNFTYNYICWRPERVRAFAATKWMTPGKPTPISFQVPGILATGEKDQAGRIEYITKAFAGAAGQHAKWAYLYEKGAGHDISQGLFDFIHSFFVAVCQPDAGDPPVLMDLETGNSEAPDSIAAGTCWFPNHSTAAAWRALHLTDSLQDLTTKLDQGK